MKRGFRGKKKDYAIVKKHKIILFSAKKKKKDFFAANLPKKTQLQTLKPSILSP